jgi:TRAP-type mannitol/chloroaromatic compound transport system substrate-binding protein
MALPFPISAGQTDAKSVVDDNLMDSIRLDLDYLDGLITGGSTILNWNVNGELIALNSWKKAVDTAAVVGAFTPGICRAALKKSGTSGVLKFDIRKHATPKTPIIEIANQFGASTQSVNNVAPALATQSIARSTSQISTQSISLVKSTINVQSIIQVPGTNKWRYNLASAPDSDWLVGDSVTFAGCTDANNNGTFNLVEISQSGFPSVVITNASGVAQTSAAGTIQLNLWSYNYTNPVSTEFVAGENFTSASHTDANNNGSLTIYKINQGGNNILVKNSAGVAQGGAVGTADVLRWQYNYSSTPSATDFIVGENAKMASHTNPANDGNFRITAVNQGGNNIIVYNTAGVAQGGVAGNANTNRWIYAYSVDPSADVTAGDNVTFASHTTPANNGTFEVVQVNRSASNNLVIYNESGVTQAGVAGTVVTTKKIVKFSSDQSSVYTTDSLIEIAGCPDGTYNWSPGREAFEVLEVNRGGGANYNVVIENSIGTSQASPAGYVQTEMRSIFTILPEIAADVTSLEANQIINDSFTDFVAGSISADTVLGLYVLEMQGGDPQDLTVFLQ